VVEGPRAAILTTRPAHPKPDITLSLAAAAAGEHLIRLLPQKLAAPHSTEPEEAVGLLAITPGRQVPAVPGVPIPPAAEGLEGVRKSTGAMAVIMLSAAGMAAEPVVERVRVRVESEELAVCREAEAEREEVEEEMLAKEGQAVEVKSVSGRYREDRAWIKL